MAERERENRRMKLFQIEKYEIVSKQLPKEFDGYKIIFLTDLHDMEYGMKNQYLLKQIDAQKPDCIMIAGDMIVGKKEFNSKVSLRLLKSLSQRYPVYYALGNHEKRLSLYPETKHTTYKRYQQAIKSFGVHYLANETITLQKGSSSIQITGLDLNLRYYQKIYHAPVMQRSYLEQTLGKNNNSYTILLAHNPKYFPNYAEWGADLVLSGHVHGGIIILPRIGGVIAPNYELFPKYDSGHFFYKQSQMVLSRGLGVHTLKIRLWNSPEVSVITLKKK